MFSLKPDFEQSRRRYDAFWHGSVADRPPVDIRLPKPGARPLPEKTYASFDERWMDVDFRAERMALELENTDFIADSMPVAFPNLGPEIYSAWCGCGYHFSADTAWSTPCVYNWDADIAAARVNWDHSLFALTERFTKNLLELGKGKFMTGLTDFHPGGDHIAALRDPQTMAVDMIENIDHVRAELVRSQVEFFTAYDHFYNMIKKGGSLACSWMGSLFGEGKFYIPSNDFSCMVSKKMFDDVFLEGIAAECRFYDQSIYHLDGPGALRHLDSLLQIKELDAIQWVYGAGNEGFDRWVDVYRRIQAAGKGIALYIDLSELPRVFEELTPEGVFFAEISGVDGREMADVVIQRITNWR